MHIVFFGMFLLITLAFILGGLFFEQRSIFLLGTVLLMSSGLLLFASDGLFVDERPNGNVGGVVSYDETIILPTDVSYVAIEWSLFGAGLALLFLNIFVSGSPAQTKAKSSSVFHF